MKKIGSHWLPLPDSNSTFLTKCNESVFITITINITTTVTTTITTTITTTTIVPTAITTATSTTTITTTTTTTATTTAITTATATVTATTTATVLFGLEFLDSPDYIRVLSWNFYGICQKINDVQYAFNTLY